MEYVSEKIHVLNEIFILEQKFNHNIKFGKIFFLPQVL